MQAASHEAMKRLGEPEEIIGDPPEAEKPIEETTLPSWLSPSPRLSSIPQEMRDTSRWLVHRNKQPFYVDGTPRRGALDTLEDIARLGSLTDALALYQRGGYDGLGFALGPDGTGNHWQGIDLDKVEEKELTDLVSQLPGYVERSPSGRGVHSIGYGEAFKTLGSNGSGIESYSQGRFFTVTGNAICGRVECIAGFVLDVLAHHHTKQRNDDFIKSQPVSAQVAPETLRALQSALDYLPSDDRELWVRMGHALCALGERGFEMWDDWSQKSLKYDQDDAVRVWNSFRGSRTDFRAVFAEAQRQGWINPNRHDLVAFNADISGFGWSGKGKPPAFQFVPLQGTEAAPEGLPHIVSQLIPTDEVTLLSGHGGGGKSFIALIIAVHVALGKSISSFQVQQGNVIFFSAEDGSRVLRYRLAKVCRAYQINPADLEGKLHLIDASEINSAMYSSSGTEVMETLLLHSLAEEMTALDARFVVIDNASDVFEGEEIKRSHVRGFIRALRSRLARPGRAVLLLAHINKAAASGTAIGKEDYSGSTAWHNSVRSRLSMKPSGQDVVAIEHQKANLGLKASPIFFDWVAGVPMARGVIPSAEVLANEAARKESDKKALVEIIKDFDKRGTSVTTATNGQYSMFRLLSVAEGFPTHLSSGSLARLMHELETEGRIVRRFVKTAQRKEREAFTCDGAPNPYIAPAQVSCMQEGQPA